jgi:hypothetical protein
VGVIESTGVPSTGAVSRAVATHMVDGSKSGGYVTAELNSGLGLWGAAYEKGDSIVAALFLTRLEQAQDFKLPKGIAELAVPQEWSGAETFDLMGMPLGKAGPRLKVGYAPVYLRVAGGDAQAVRLALKKMVEAPATVTEPTAATTPAAQP